MSRTFSKSNPPIAVPVQGGVQIVGFLSIDDLERALGPRGPSWSLWGRARTRLLTADSGAMAIRNGSVCVYAWNES